MTATRPDLRNGVAFDDLPEGSLLTGTVGEDEVILVRRGEAVFAVGAYCTHYRGSLGEGLLVGDTLRCPLHHACFSLRTGQALHAPALDPIDCWRVERVGNKVFVREKLPATPAPSRPASGLPASVVIVGGGAAGLAAADMLRKEGYPGPVKLISADDFPPCDRPNLSKDYLAGTAPDEWIPLRADSYYSDRQIELLLEARVSSLDPGGRRVRLDDGREFGFGALLLATGADPVRLEIPGATAAQIGYLRSFADARALVARARNARRVIVVGASFIGLEVAASLRERGIEVHVVGPESVPMLRVLGEEAGRFIQGLHESHGVVFHLGASVSKVNGRQAVLSNGTVVDADFLVLGVGVRPSISLAAAAGLATDRGVSVNEYLETSSPGIYAAGDIARWPDPHTGERIRVEHWVVAERQGQVAARNMLGAREKFTAAPFFWSHHYDVTINYVGHAEQWDSIQVEGSLAAHDCELRYLRAGRPLAVATIGRDLRSLQAEQSMEG